MKKMLMALIGKVKRRKVSVENKVGFEAHHVIHARLSSFFIARIEKVRHRRFLPDERHERKLHYTVYLVMIVLAHLVYEVVLHGFHYGVARVLIEVRLDDFASVAILFFERLRNGGHRHYMSEARFHKRKYHSGFCHKICSPNVAFLFGEPRIARAILYYRSRSCGSDGQQAASRT